MGPATPLEKTPCSPPGKSLSITTACGAPVHQGNPNFFSQQIFETGQAKELHHIGLAEYERCIKERDLVPGGFEQDEQNSKDDKQFFFHAGLPLGQTPRHKVQGCKHSQPHHDAMYVVDMEGAQTEIYQTHNGCVICSNTIPKGTLQASYPRDGKENLWNVPSLIATLLIKRSMITSQIQRVR